MNDADYKIILEAVNKTAPAFKSVKKSVADVDKVYKKSLKKMEKQTKSFNKTLKKIEPTLNTIGTVGAVAFAGIVYGLKKAIDVASDFEETNSKFEVVFKDVGTQAEAMAQRLQYSYGLSGLASRQLLSSTGDLLTGFGFTGDSALDLSGKVNTLAVDLASFTNAQGGAVAVSDALTKALLGERDSLKTYGIAILDADVKAELLAKGQSKLTGEALRQASAYATLDIAMRQSKNAQGDFERTQESYANQVRVAQARIEDLSVAIGTAFLPAVTEMIVEITPLITKIGKWSEENQGAVKVLAELAISITALSASLRILTPVVSFLTSAWVKLGAIAVWLKANPLALLVAWAVWFAGQLKDLIAITYDVEITWKEVWNEIILFMTGIKDSIIGFFADMTSSIWGAVKAMAKLVTYLSPLRAIANIAGSVGGFVSSAVSKVSVPSFATGGTVGGPIGAPVMAQVHGGEQIVPYNRRGNDMGVVNININGGIFADENGARLVGDKIVEAMRTQFRF